MVKSINYVLWIALAVDDLLGNCSRALIVADFKLWSENSALDACDQLEQFVSCALLEFTPWHPDPMWPMLKSWITAGFESEDFSQNEAKMCGCQTPTYQHHKEEMQYSLHNGARTHIHKERNVEK